MLPGESEELLWNGSEEGEAEAGEEGDEAGHAAAAGVEEDAGAAGVEAGVAEVKLADE